MSAQVKPRRSSYGLSAGRFPRFAARMTPDTREHGWPTELNHQHKRFDRGLPFGQEILFRQPGPAQSTQAQFPCREGMLIAC